MSQVGQKLFCNGVDCEEVAALPIALKQELPLLRQLPSAKGWLFLQSSSENRHFCPSCAAKMIQDSEQLLPMFKQRIGE